MLLKDNSIAIIICFYFSVKRIQYRELDDVDLENLTERDRRRMKNDKCPICDVDFTPKDVYCKRMPCGHLFHDQECLMPVIYFFVFLFF